jgi:hypothetical protein
MPKKVMDYSKTIIYKIVCNDPSVEECYVGHTTNFKSRKSVHKNNCNNEQKREYHYYVYNFIRNNKGWKNWNMVMIEEYIDCQNYLQARTREQYWITKLKASLNKIDSFTTIEEHKQKNLSRVNNWAKLNQEKVKENKQQWAEQNKEKVKQNHKNWRDLNRDKINEKARLQYQQKKLVQIEN